MWTVKKLGFYCQNDPRYTMTMLTDIKKFAEKEKTVNGIQLTSRLSERDVRFKL